MVVRLRLQRFGQIHKPFYRMVAADSRSPRDGKHLEIVRDVCSSPHVSSVIHNHEGVIWSNFLPRILIS